MVYIIDNPHLETFYNRLTTDESPIPPDIFKEFVQAITDEFLQLDKNSDETVIAQGLETEHLLYRLREHTDNQKTFFDGYDLWHFDKAIAYLQKALDIEIKHRLSGELTTKEMKRLFILKKWFNGSYENSRTKNVVAYGENFSGATVVYRDDGKKFVDLHDRRIHRRAMQRLFKILPHDNIVEILEYFPDRDTLCAKHYPDLETIETKLEGLTFNFPWSLSDLLSVMVDTVRTCEFLEKNGLILQDLSLDNIGVIKNASGGYQALLFDLDGIYIIGEQANTLLNKGNLLMPNGPSYNDPYQIDNTITVNRMNYEIGTALKHALVNRKGEWREFSNEKQLSKEKLEVVFKQIFDIANLLTCDLNDRISLEEAGTRLRSLTKELEEN